MEDMLKLLPSITVQILVVVALLTAILQLIKKIEEVWKKLRPSIKYLVLVATQIIPTGTVIWYFMYWAAQNPSRLTEPVVFLLLIAESTILVSLYALFWGVWLYPKLQSFVRQERNAQRPSDINQPSVDSKRESNTESQDEDQ